MRTLLLVIILLTSISTQAQVTEHSLYCRQFYTVQLPNDFKYDHHNYTEGDFFYLYRLDTVARKITTLFVFHCGTSVPIPHLKDSTFVVEDSLAGERSGRQLNGHYWRELNRKPWINIYYKDATYEEKQMLDEVIADLVNQLENKGK